MCGHHQTVQYWLNTILSLSRLPFDRFVAGSVSSGRVRVLQNDRSMTTISTITVGPDQALAVSASKHSLVSHTPRSCLNHGLLPYKKSHVLNGWRHDFNTTCQPERDAVRLLDTIGQSALVMRQFVPHHPFKRHEAISTKCLLPCLARLEP